MGTKQPWVSLVLVPPDPAPGSTQGALWPTLAPEAREASVSCSGSPGRALCCVGGRGALYCFALSRAPNTADQNMCLFVHCRGRSPAAIPGLQGHGPRKSRRGRRNWDSALQEPSWPCLHGLRASHRHILACPLPAVMPAERMQQCEGGNAPPPPPCPQPHTKTAQNPWPALSGHTPVFADPKG